MEEENKVEEVVEENTTTEEATPIEEPVEEIKTEENIAPVEETKNNDKEPKKDKKKYNTFRTIAIILAIIIIILLLCLKCGNGKKYKIILHNGDEIIEVDENFKLSDLEVEGGIVSFLVDSDGHIVDPSKKLDPKKEYSTHIIPEGKESVKVTYVNGDWSLTVKYQKGAGLLFPADPTKPGYVFIGWKDEDLDDYPIFMTPVNHDMTLVAQFGKSESKGGKCSLNCDTDGDGKCDLNCDTDGDGKADSNIDLDGDGKCDLNCDADGDTKCDYKCDTDGDGACDLDCDSLDPSMEYTYASDTINFSCKSKSFMLYMNKSTEFVSATFDGKEVAPDYWDMDANQYEKIAAWDASIAKYLKSGKTVEFIGTVIKTDETGQKYYRIKTISFIFPSEDACKEEVININLDRKFTQTCELSIGGWIDDIDILTDKGLVINENSTITLIENKMGAHEGKITQSCVLNPSFVSMSHGIEYNDDVDMKAETRLFNESRNGKTTTDTCKWEVITDGKKYIVTKKLILTYDYNCDLNDIDPLDQEENPNPEPEPTPTPEPTSQPQTSETYTCPNGYTLNGKKCTKPVTIVKDAKVTYSCERGYNDIGNNKCSQDVAKICPSGYYTRGNDCIYIISDPIMDCYGPVLLEYRDGKCYEYGSTTPSSIQPQKACNGGTLYDDAVCGENVFDGPKECPSGTTENTSNNMCTKVVAATPNYSCSSYGSDYLLEETKCTKTTTETINATKK